MICQHHYGPSVISNLTLDRIYLEHKNYFSIKALDILAKKNKLQITKINFFEKKNFFTAIISKDLQKYKKKKLYNIIHKENKISIKNLNIFHERLRKIYNKINTILNKSKYKNYEIIGFGSSIGSIPLLLYFDLEKKIKYLVDDFPLKKFFPLTRLKIDIKKFEKLNLKKNVILFSLTPRYFSIIKKKVLAKINKKSVFINLLPNFKIIKKT